MLLLHYLQTGLRGGGGDGHPPVSILLPLIVLETPKIGLVIELAQVKYLTWNY
jgi:hypothetical protein